MKPRLKKILCPNKGSHPDVDKVLAIYSERPFGAPRKLWIHCDYYDRETQKRCRWIEIRFNRLGGATAEIMPKNVNFDVTEVPVMVVDDA